MKPFRFAWHSNVQDNPPSYPLLEKADTDEKLTREEKDEIANLLYGTFGSEYSIYKSGGWAWPMRECKQIKRILVCLVDYGWSTYYAPDKTSLRKALKGYKIVEMIYA